MKNCASEPVRALVTLSVMLLAGCASDIGNRRAESPSWVSQPDAGLAGSSFLTAVGVGRTRSDAEDAAYVNLAREIETRVQSTESIHRVAREATSANHTLGYGERVTAEHELLLETNRELLGVEIRDYWYDEPSRTYFARATMNRAVASVAYQQEIARLETQVVDAVRLEDSDATPLARIRALHEARDARRRIDALGGTLSTIDPGVGPDLARSSTPSAGEISQKLEALRSSFGVAIRIVGGESEPMMQALLRAVEDQNLSVTSKKTAIVEIVVRFDVTHNASFNPTSQVSRWQLSLKAVDLSDNRSVATRRLSGNVAARNRLAAESDAAAAARRELRRQIRPFLDEALRVPLESS